MQAQSIWKPTIVISAFPACGKSYTYNHYNGNPYTMLDSDSSKFSWVYENGVKTDKRNPNFITDYMDHIKENIGKVDCIFVSSHKEVREALRDNKIKYFMVYPELSMKEEMLQRMKDRGNDKNFISMMEKNYEKFITEIEEETATMLVNVREEQKETHIEGTHYYTPFHEIRINKDRPYIDNLLIDFLMDNCMGNLSSLHWNYGKRED